MNNFPEQIELLGKLARAMGLSITTFIPIPRGNAVFNVAVLTIIEESDASDERIKRKRASAATPQ